MNFNELVMLINSLSASDNSFEEKEYKIVETIDKINKTELISILKEIGTIPEYIEHDSSEEKLYSKMTDILLSKCFNFLGLESITIKSRSNSADVLAKSNYHDYTLVSDAKAFRISRTAKNQKDFKVGALNSWKKDNDYAVLVSPYFHYPKNQSQIFSQALEYNVCLFSWEHLLFLIENDIRETEILNLSLIWNINNAFLSTIYFHDRKNNFFNKMNVEISSRLNLNFDEINVSIEKSKPFLINRGLIEIEYWLKKIDEIKSYDKDTAISSLLNALKIDNKISAINNFINILNGSE